MVSCVYQACHRSKSWSHPCFKAGGLYCFVTYQLGRIDFRSSHLAKQCLEISGHEPFYAHCKEVADFLQVTVDIGLTVPSTNPKQLGSEAPLVVTAST